MDGKIRAEWNSLKKVVIHRPGMEMFFGLMEPYSSLYERAFSRSGARREHEMLETILKEEFGVQVIRLKQATLQAASTIPIVKRELINLARETMEYTGDANAIARAKEEFEENIKYLDIAHFFNILIINPSLNFVVQKGSRNVQLNITKRQPLANLYFMRDQQFVTDSGIVLCRLAKPARRRETIVTKFFWENVLGLSLLHEIEEPGTIEGGEFIPMGKFALVGQGDRTNRDAIEQLLSLDFEFEELAVVHQPLHPLVSSDKPDPMINMHLDTYFNVASSKVVVGCEMLIKEAKVEIFHNEGMGTFTKDPKETNLYDYIKSKGFEVINITTLEQMSYASNFLCIKDGNILAVESERNVKKVIDTVKRITKDDPNRYGKLLDHIQADYEHLRGDGEFFPHKKAVYHMELDVYPINIPNLTGGYGAAHCMTCALERG
ncbi:MAG: Arginine deiminase [Candidatus Anoxychlamydiales bacterium]|nr:Arginine deiminase [Candidatus Anoxychlamydiales bacterium]